jgi:hypothetical protein
MKSLVFAMVVGLSSMGCAANLASSKETAPIIETDARSYEQAFKDGATKFTQRLADVGLSEEGIAQSLDQFKLGYRAGQEEAKKILAGVQKSRTGDLYRAGVQSATHTTDVLVGKLSVMSFVAGYVSAIKDAIKSSHTSL